MKVRGIQIVVTIVFVVVMAVSLFGALGKVQVCATDEAVHGINAYEMTIDHSYLVNTLKHEVDYFNSKPPLMLWLIILSYRFFGFTPLGMRVPSVVAGLLLYLLLLLFCKKKWGTTEMLLFAAYLPACRILFDFHMFRSGDMDAVYVLFFCLAMYSLYLSGEKPRLGMSLGGLFAGLAFMAKGPHAALIAAIVILFYPFIMKTVKVRHLCLAACVAAAVVLPWAIARYCYDGLALFADLLFHETVGRVEGSTFSLHYFKEMGKEPVCDIFLILAAAGTVIGAVKRLKLCREDNRPVKDALKGIPKDLWLLVIWFCVVFGGYTLAKSNLDWYIYSAFIPLGLLGAKGGAYIIGLLTDAAEQKKWLAALREVILYGVLAACLVISVLHIKTYPFNGSDGGSRNNDLYSDLLMLKEECGSELDGRTVYMQDSRNVYKTDDKWEMDTVFYAETMFDWMCEDGGVEAFLETDDMDALLVFDKRLWDDYINVLTGYVILDDRNYLMFSKHTYGEE